MSNLDNFAQNLRVWSRRMQVRNLGPLAEKIAQAFGNIPLGRQAAIKAVAMEWFASRGLSRDLCKDCAAVAAIDVYQGVYYPMEKAPPSDWTSPSSEAQRLHVSWQNSAKRPERHTGVKRADSCPPFLPTVRVPAKSGTINP